MLEVLDIFRQKTAPAFHVALQVGATLAGRGEAVAEVLGRYSEAVGIAYQIRDDLEDLAAAPGASGATPGADDVSALRPSLPLAMALERAPKEDRALLEAAWRRSQNVSAEAVRDAIARADAADRCRRLLDSYKEEAVRSLMDLEDASLKGLLRRVVGKVFGLEVKGWCSEFEAGNDAGRAALASPAG